MPVRLYRVSLGFALLALVSLACQITLQTSSPPSTPKVPSPTQAQTPFETALQPTLEQATAAPVQPTEGPTGIPISEGTPIATQPSVTLPFVPAAPTGEPARSSYVMQAGSPLAIPNFAHPEKGCNWLGLAGQVFDQNQKSVNGLVVKVTGTLEGKDVYLISLTGVASEYGEGGYEVELADHVIDSQGSLSVQVFSSTGEPLSQSIAIDTYADCSRNLILVNFVEAPKQTYRVLLPMVFKNEGD